MLILRKPTRLDYCQYLFNFFAALKLDIELFTFKIRNSAKLRDYLIQQLNSLSVKMAFV